MISNEEAKKWKPLVYKISNKYKNNQYKLEIDDLIQVGYIGLLKGFRTFKSEQGASLKSHLHNCIEWSILSELEYWKNNKRITLCNSSSIDVQIGEDNDATLGELLEDVNTNTENAVLEKMLTERYKQEVLKTLKDTEESKVTMLILFEDMSMQDVANTLKLDMEYVRKIYRRCRDKLTRNMFIRIRYKEYKRNTWNEKYKSISYYGCTEEVAFTTMKLEQRLFNF